MLRRCSTRRCARSSASPAAPSSASRSSAASSTATAAPMRRSRSRGSTRRRSIRSCASRQKRSEEIPESAVYIGTFAKTDEQRALLNVLSGGDEIGRPFIMSKQVPADRLAILRQAFNATMKDPAFLADMQKLGHPVQPLPGETGGSDRRQDVGRLARGAEDRRARSTNRAITLADDRPMYDRPMSDSPLTPIEIGLTAAIVTVEDEEPAILVAGEAGGAQDEAAHGTAVRAVRSARTSHLRDRAARLGRGADRPDRRLCRAALHLRRPRPPCAPRRHRRAHGVGRLSRAHPHVRQRAARARRRLPAVVPLLSVGGLARGASGDPRQDDPAAAQRMGRDRRRRKRRMRSGGASGCASPSAPAAARGTRSACSTATSCSTRPG